MNAFGMVIKGPTGVVVLDPDTYTVRLVESKIYLGGRVRYWAGSPNPEIAKRYKEVPMPLAKKGMFAVLSPLDGYTAGMNIDAAGWGNDNEGRVAALGVPVPTVEDGKVLLDVGPVIGWVNLNLAIYLLSYE